MSLNDISKALEASVDVIRRLNGVFDKERKELKALEEALNSLGNPGYWFRDKESFTAEPVEGWIEQYHLCFNKGRIQFKTIICDDKGQNEKDVSIRDLSAVPIRYIDYVLKQLPKFLQKYQEFLQAKVEDNGITLYRLTKVVETINSALQTETTA